MPDSARFKFHPEAIGHVLGDRLLAVPVYQRSYSWGTEQVSDFWTDLSSAFEENRAEYFLGNIVLSEEGSNGSYTIIDGQQRLATTLILLAAIRDEFRQRGDDKRASIIQNTYMATADLDTGEDVPRVRMNSDDNLFFRTVIVDGQQPKQDEILHSSHVLIYQAHRELQVLVHATAESAGKEWARRLSEWTKFLRENVQVIVVDVPTEADAFLIFETLNDRGADLTIADLLKNYLFGRAGDDLNAVRDGWMAALGALEMSAENSVFTGFLRHLWSSKYGATRERLLYKSIRQRITTQVRTDEEFEASFAKARVTKAKLARYYLTALEETEEGEAEPELVPNEDEEKLNLEHILPQNPKDKDWNQFTEEEQKAWVHRLGNMVLLQKGPNGRIGNKPWSTKKPVLRKSKLALTHRVSQEDEWSKKVIDKRQQVLASLATKTWSRKP